MMTDNKREAIQDTFQAALNEQMKRFGEYAHTRVDDHFQRSAQAIADIAKGTAGEALTPIPSRLGTAIMSLPVPPSAGSTVDASAPPDVERQLDGLNQRMEQRQRAERMEAIQAYQARKDKLDNTRMSNDKSVERYGAEARRLEEEKAAIRRKYPTLDTYAVRDQAKAAAYAAIEQVWRDALTSFHDTLSTIEDRGN